MRQNGNNSPFKLHTFHGRSEDRPPGPDGIQPRENGGRRRSLPVVSLSCNYRKTTTFKDRIEIEVSIVNVSPLKMKLAYTMKVGEDIVFTGESVHCFLENGHPVRIDEWFPVFILHSPPADHNWGRKWISVARKKFNEFLWC